MIAYLVTHYSQVSEIKEPIEKYSSISQRGKLSTGEDFMIFVISGKFETNRFNGFSFSDVKTIGTISEDVRLAALRRVRSV